MILYDSVKVVLILPLSQILMKGQSLAFKSWTIIKGGSMPFLLYKAGKFRGRRHCFFRHSWTSRLACLFSNFDYLNFYSFRVYLRWRDCSYRISKEAHIWSRPSCKGGGGREIRLKGLKFKNGRDERSFIFAFQYKLKLKKIINENLGSLRGAF